MATEVQGVHVNFYVRDNGTTQTWRKLTCEQTLVFDLNNDVTNEKTKCGIFKGIQVSDFKVSGTGVANVAPTASEYSIDLMQLDQVNIQKKDFRIQNEAYGSVGLSDQILVAGSGYFVTSQETFNNGETVKYSFSFEGTGTSEFHES